MGMGTQPPGLINGKYGFPLIVIRGILDQLIIKCVFVVYLIEILLIKFVRLFKYETYICSWTFIEKFCLVQE